MEAYQVCYIKDEPHNDFSRAQATEAAAFAHHLNGAFSAGQKDLMALARSVNKQNPVGKRSQVRRSAFASVGAEHWPDYDEKYDQLPIEQRPHRATMRNSNRRSSSASPAPSPARKVFIPEASPKPQNRSSSKGPKTQKPTTSNGDFKIPKKVKSVVVKASK